MKRLRRHKQIPGIELPGRLENMVSALFPLVQAHRSDDVTPSFGGDSPDLFSVDEIVAAAKTMPNNKAPGPDEICYEILKVVVYYDPQRFYRVFNNCLRDGQFPRRWKKGKLVLMRKPGKPLDSPSAYRPICLLDGCGKLLEKLVVSKLRDHLKGEHAIASNQYGFRRGRSTLDALGGLKSIVQTATTGHVYHHRLEGMLTLDVRNAFNSTSWGEILEAARAKRVPGWLQNIIGAYLSDMAIAVSAPVGSTSFDREMSCGVPQGSVLGPDL